jgi:hypothetical protein
VVQHSILDLWFAGSSNLHLKVRTSFRSEDLNTDPQELFPISTSGPSGCILFGYISPARYDSVSITRRRIFLKYDFGIEGHYRHSLSRLDHDERTNYSPNTCSKPRLESIWRQRSCRQIAKCSYSSSSTILHWCSDSPHRNGL